MNKTIGEQSVALTVPPPPRRISAALRQLPTESYVPPQQVVLEGHEPQRLVLRI
ncbi:hypothetical protein [Streptomyces sp. NBC_01235]|uniref:hypothetical protein n=1 Tax=Streptomyces sp. NBC_01235 TaxID=2903788 RepID=UPI002E0F574C|nr:hypothetical protein OG289_39295 [Streptomyces sp. NBC_01235]